MTTRSEPLPADLAAAHAMILAQREQLTLAKSEVAVGLCVMIMVLRRACYAISRPIRQIGRDSSPAWQFSLASATLRCRRRPEWHLLSMQDLRWRALAEIRKQPGCSDVQGIAINRVSDQQAENNWSLCVVPAGAADANTAARAALHVQSVLRRDYDLVPT
jgi:hypothetical protein